jgi:phosphatidylglycerophosphate synthase
MDDRAVGERGLLPLVTIGRLALVPMIAASFMSSPALTSIGLLLFMFADLFDGVLARSAGRDGPGRRVVDSVVDRMAIDACLIVAGAIGAMPVLLVCAFLLRDLYCAIICAAMVGERRVAIKSDLLYRGLNCGLAGWALAAPFLSADGRLVGAAVLLAVSIVVACDLTRSVGLIKSAPEEIRDRVISASDLRRGRVDWASRTGREDRPGSRATQANGHGGRPLAPQAPRPAI